jgi:ABC-type taurine transport system substrate-binding protein
VHAIPHLRRIDIWLREERCRAAKECVRCFARATAVVIFELRKVVPVLPTIWPFPASSCTRSKRRGSTTRHLAWWAIASLVLLIYTDVGKAEAIKVAISQRGFWDSSFVEFATRQGFFKDEGIEVEPFYTEGGAGTLDAVMSGSVDIAMSNGLLGTLGRFAKGAPIRVVAAEMTGASDAFWYARADSGIKTLKDAAGKSVAFSSPGSSTNLVVLALVKQAGVRRQMICDRLRPVSAEVVAHLVLDLSGFVLV